jgi:hypothetical protein
LIRQNRQLQLHVEREFLHREWDIIPVAEEVAIPAISPELDGLLVSGDERGEGSDALVGGALVVWAVICIEVANVRDVVALGGGGGSCGIVFDHSGCGDEVEAVGIGGGISFDGRVASYYCEVLEVSVGGLVGSLLAGSYCEVLEMCGGILNVVLGASLGVIAGYYCKAIEVGVGCLVDCLVAGDYCAVFETCSSVLNMVLVAGLEIFASYHSHNSEVDVLA